MQMTFRWYGQDDPVKIEYIRQIPGMKGIVTAIYDIPVGEVWPLDKIMELKASVEKHGLELICNRKCTSTRRYKIRITY